MTLEARHVHFIGIGGIGTSGIARMLLARGSTVSGSDLREGPLLEQLRELGARVVAGHDPAQIPEEAELVVISAAITPDNVELQAVRRRGLPVLKYAQALGRLLDQHTGIAVAGTHGKSTTTAMVAYILQRAGLSPSFVVGAEVPQLGGSSGTGSGPHFVVEACEYDRSFLHLHPTLAVILNIEEDHLDYYRDLDDITAAFTEFAAGVRGDGLLVVNGQDPRAGAATADVGASVETFALEEPADWEARELAEQRGCYRFSLNRRGQDLGQFQLGIPGRHYVVDAVAAVAVSVAAGAGVEDCRSALADFRGANRRFEHVGEARAVQVIDDYAHHPTEIRATLRAVRQHFPGARLWCVFQPHQHSRTRFLLADFAGSFDDADRVLLPDIYFVRDSEQERRAISSADLVAAIQANGRSPDEVRYLPTFEAIEETLLGELAPGDVLVTMGAGDVWKLGRRLLQSLGVEGQAASAPGPAHDPGHRRRR